MVYEVRFTKEAKKDVAKLTPKLKQKLKKNIQDTIGINPYSTPIKIRATRELQRKVRSLSKKYRHIQTDLQPIWENENQYKMTSEEFF
jgi:mRNA-degrading endonuclease RelE of RelBE toxin-antitoxin system